MLAGCLRTLVGRPVVEAGLKGLGAVHDEVGARLRVVTGDVAVFGRHPDVGPCAALVLAVSGDATSEPIVVRGINPDAHVEIVSKHLVQGTDPLDDDDAGGLDDSWAGHLGCGPVPLLVRRANAGEQDVEHLVAQAGKIELRATPERIRSHDLDGRPAVGQRPSYCPSQRRFSCATVPADAHQKKRVARGSAVDEAKDVGKRRRHCATHAIGA